MMINVCLAPFEIREKEPPHTTLKTLLTTLPCKYPTATILHKQLNPENIKQMGTLQLNSYGLASFNVPLNYTSNKSFKFSRQLSFSRGKIRAVGTVSEGESTTSEPEEPPFVAIAFVHSVLLPDGTPDIHVRKVCGGQKLRDIMLNSNIELYGPYARPLLNCAGGGTCGTCMVEVVQGKELLNPRTDKETKNLKKKPKNWRLACQTTVGSPDSRGAVVFQQLPEWKNHEWNYRKILPSEVSQKILPSELSQKMLPSELSQ